MIDLILPWQVQQQIREEKTGTPTIVVLITGQTATLGPINDKAHGILEAWYPGQEGGTALQKYYSGMLIHQANTISSKGCRSDTGFYNYKPSARGYYKKPGTPENPGRDYVFLDTEPLYNFGYGLSYTTFEYSELKVLNQEVEENENIRVSVKVKNTGEREGKEAVQLYINDLVSSVTTPVKELKGFKKINLKPGEKAEVLFEIPQSDLAIIDRNMKQVVEPGEFEVRSEIQKQNLEFDTPLRLYPPEET